MAPRDQISDTKRCIIITQFIAMLIYSAVNLSATIKAYSGLPSQVEEFEDIISNWQTKTIIDIKREAICSDGYEPAYTDTWPGTVAGCYQFPNLYDKPCAQSKRDTIFDSVDVPAVPAKSLAFWYPSDTICVKRTSENWASMAGLVVNGNCPSGYLKCGSSDENVFCTRETTCPVTNFDGSRGEDALPLVEFRIDEPAYDIFNGGDRFGLLKEKLPTKHRPSTWTFADQISENALFKQNGFFYTITSQLSSDNIGSLKRYYVDGQYSYAGSNRYWTLLSRQYTPWKMSCRDKMPALIKKSGFGPSLERIQLALMIMSIISFCVTVIMLPIIQLRHLSSSKEMREMMDKKRSIAELVFELLQLPVQIAAIVLTFTTRNLFVSATEMSCSSWETNAVLGRLADQLKSSCDANAVAIAILAAKLLFDYALHRYQRYKESKQRAIYNEGEQQHSQDNQDNNTTNNMLPQNSSQLPPAVLYQIQPSPIRMSEQIQIVPRSNYQSHQYTELYPQPQDLERCPPQDVKTEMVIT